MLSGYDSVSIYTLFVERMADGGWQRRPQKKDADLLFFNFILFLVGDEDMGSSECIVSIWRTRK